MTKSYKTIHSINYWINGSSIKLLIWILITFIIIDSHYKLEAELASMTWKIRWDDILATKRSSLAAGKRLGSMTSLNIRANSLPVIKHLINIIKYYT